MVMDDKTQPGEQMIRVDEATLQELVHGAWVVPANWRPLTGAVVDVVPAWPNTDPTLTAFHAPKEDDHAAKAG
jgi:hypothetical protein